MNQLKKNRKPMRLKGYDYSQAGLYFITICTKNREHIFGKIVNGRMVLNEYGNIIHDCWKNIPDQYNNVILDEYIVMPNHFHGIIQLNPPVTPVGAQFIASINKSNKPTTNKSNKPDNHFFLDNQNIIKPKQNGINRSDAINLTSTRTAITIGTVVRSFKARCTHAINKMNNNIGVSIWQRNYYEHIIRDENEYKRISNYIINNPKNW